MMGGPNDRTTDVMPYSLGSVQSITWRYPIHKSRRDTYLQRNANSGKPNSTLNQTKPIGRKPASHSIIVTTQASCLSSVPTPKRGGKWV
jgi:hypothetical protein